MSGNAPQTDEGAEDDAEDGNAQRLPVWRVPVPQDGGCRGAHREDGGLLMSCCRCIEVDTPQSIMEDGSMDGEYPAETDIFEEITDTANGNYTTEGLMSLMLWLRYRYEGIGSCDAKRWVQVMADRLDMIGDKWETILTALEDVDMADLAEMAYTRRVDRTAIPDTVGTVRTVGHSGTDSTVTGDETLPQSPVDGYSYLDRRTTATRTNGQTDTETYHPNERDEETYKEYRDIEAATFARLVDRYPDIPARFAAEFKDLFLGRWRDAGILHGEVLQLRRVAVQRGIPPAGRERGHIRASGGDRPACEALEGHPAGHQGRHVRGIRERQHGGAGRRLLLAGILYRAGERRGPLRAGLRRAYHADQIPRPHPRVVEQDPDAQVRIHA